MTAIPNSKMTLEEYLEFDYNSEGRFEYVNGDVIEMSGGSPEHALLSSQFGRVLGNKIAPKGCLVYSSDVKIKVPVVPTYRYADVSALCGKPVYQDYFKQRLLINPTLIAEVLSPSTESYDKDKKFREYKSIESLKEYLLISQEEVFVTLYSKYNEKFWFQSQYESGETLKLESLDCELSVDEIYAGITFELE
jgi:Uma2 family endonuclease